MNKKNTSSQTSITFKQINKILNITQHTKIFLVQNYRETDKIV